MADAPQFSIRVTNVVDKGEGDAANLVLRFYPTGGSEELKSKGHCVVLDKSTGYIVRAYREDDKSPIDLEKTRVGSFVTTAPMGLPIEWFNGKELPQGKLEIEGTKRTIEIRKEDRPDNRYLLEMIVSEEGKEVLRVRQEWVNGAKWWRSYERVVNDKVVMSATLFTPPPPPNTSSAPANGSSSTPSKTRKVDDTPLFQDQRLSPNVKAVYPNHPKLEELLPVLSEGTGLKITVHPSLARNRPDLGGMMLAKVQCAQLMVLVEHKYPEGTYWKKNDAGYELTPPEPPAPSASSSSDESSSDATASSSAGTEAASNDRHLLVIAAATVGTVMVMMAAFGVSILMLVNKRLAKFSTNVPQTSQPSAVVQARQGAPATKVGARK
jgi:hypothetical protein